MTYLYMITHGIGQQQHSHSPPPGHGHSTHPALGQPGLCVEEVEELLLEIGRTASTREEGSVAAMLN